MLHMIALILKILGIVLAVILGIIVLLVCIILFVPVRYNLQAQFPGELENAEAKIRFSWFLRLISGEAAYQESEFKWKVRAAWSKFDSEEETLAKEPEGIEMPIETDREVQGRINPEQPETKVNESQKPEPIPEEPKKTEPEIPEPKSKEKKSVFQKLKNKLKSIWEKIKYTFTQIRDKIISVSEIKDKIVLFLNDEIHKQAFFKAKKEIKWIIRFLKPKKFSLNLHYGFEDPYTTGQVLAILSIIYPFVGDNMSVQPDFENKIFEGDVYIKGKLRMILPTIYLIKLILNKNVRMTFTDMKNFKLK